MDYSTTYHELVCDYCGLPEAECISASQGHSIHLVTPDEYQRIRQSGDYE